MTARRDVGRGGYRFARLRHALEQYLTRSQSFAHFFRQANGRSQAGHTFVGRFGLLGVTSAAPGA
jgi:hypothetical protein